MEQAINAFFLGAVIGAIITYWYTTGEKRIIASVRSCISTLAMFHDLTPAEQNRTMHPLSTVDLVRDDEILALHKWGKLLNKPSGQPARLVVKKLNPVAVAAEAIICEKLLGRSRIYFTDGTSPSVTRSRHF